MHAASDMSRELGIVPEGGMQRRRLEAKAPSQYCDLLPFPLPLADGGLALLAAAKGLLHTVGYDEP